MFKGVKLLCDIKMFYYVGLTRKSIFSMLINSGPYPLSGWFLVQCLVSLNYKLSCGGFLDRNKYNLPLHFILSVLITEEQNCSILFIHLLFFLGNNYFCCFQFTITLHHFHPRANIIQYQVTNTGFLKNYK